MAKPGLRARRERQLLEICRSGGMRLIGPNCMGIVNTAPAVSHDATFGPEMPPPGAVGFLSQSGALGLAVIDYARALGLGISTFVSVGNKADISGIVCGAGGTTAELLKDVAIRIVPLTDRDAGEMVRSLRTFPLLDGYRGRPKVDVHSLEDVLLRTASMVEAHAEIAELDLNPVIVTPDGSVVVDARVRVEAAPHRPPLGARNR